MDPTKLLEADHRQVEQLFEQIEPAEGEERASLVDQLATALRGHMELEEQIVYPAMGEVTGEEAVQEGEKEHELARKALQDMIALSPDQPGFDGALAAVKAGIEHHVEEEEGEYFPQFRKEGREQLAAIEAPFLAKRRELGLPSDAATVAEHATKEELLEQAKAAGVSGAGSMTKTQLAEALTEAQSGS
jgi:iron-sulfur cluster repair protein YtfE (RIC family)